MAMLVQPEIFQRTWGDRALPRDGSPPKDNPFWIEAITAIRRRHPQFLFVAEVYWDMEWELQQAGFDYTYDKRLYDRLREQQATPVRQHLQADTSFQDHSLRFLENHDEPRAAATFPPAVHKAAAITTLLSRGLRFFYEGQLEGRKVQVSMHLGRRPAEVPDEDVRAFYGRLLDILKRSAPHDGHWQLGQTRPAWLGNGSNAQFIAASWQSENKDPSDRSLLAVVNYGPAQAQCYLPLGLPGLRGRAITLVDLFSDVRYERQGDVLADEGLFLDMPAWGHHVFELQPTNTNL
jgi:hypothetical protein